MKFLLIHKITSATLSILVLLSTFSLTIEKHFCGDTLVDVAIFTDVEKCGMDGASDDHSERLEKSCCKNEVDIIENINVLSNKDLEDVEEVQKHFLLAFSYTFIHRFEVSSKLKTSSEWYKPPLLIKDIQVLDETYLI